MNARQSPISRFYAALADLLEADLKRERVDFTLAWDRAGAQDRLARIIGGELSASCGHVLGRIEVYPTVFTSEGTVGDFIAALRRKADEPAQGARR